MRMTRKIFCGAALAALFSLGTMTGYGALYDEFDWSKGADTTYKIIYGEDGEKEQQETEPATVPDAGSSLDGGPSINQITINEIYHEDYQVYEESVGDLFFFYSTVANGGITHEPVILDLPANLSYTVEKDGLPWEYVSGQPITAFGTYVLRICGIEDESAPLSEQKEYRAVFRFRIQQKPPQTETEAAEGLEGGAGTGLSGFADQAAGAFSPSVLYNYGGTYVGPDGLPSEIGVNSGLTGGNGAGTGNTGEGGSSAGEAGNDGNNAGEAGNAGTAGETAAAEETGAGEDETGAEAAGADETEAGAEGENGEASADAAGAGSGKNPTPAAQTYDPTTKRYTADFGNGCLLTASVPAGYVGAGPVDVSVSGEEFSLFFNDAPAELSRTQTFVDPGYYRIKAGGRTWTFAILTAVNQMDLYPAPEGMRIVEASLDGETIKPVSEGLVLMEEDGQYAFTLEGEAGELLQTGILKDTTPPEVAVNVGKGTAAIQYLSDDIAKILLEKDGAQGTEFGGYSISQPGSYRLLVYDAAGNMAEASFNLKYQMNTYAVAAIVLIFLVIIGIVVFVIHTKKTVKVR